MNTAQENLDALLLMNFGYVSAADLLLWCDQQLIISCLNRNPQSVQKAVNAAITTIQDRLRNVYDLSQEFTRQDLVFPSAAATIADGAITEATVLAPGTNYYAVPTVTVVPAAGDPGIDAVLTAEISESRITAIELMRPGGRYLQPPAISFIGGGGSGAAATCTLDNFGHVAAIQLVNGGTGWTSIPQIMFTSVDGFGVGAAAAAQVAFGQLTGITVTTPGSGYAAIPIIEISGGQALDSRHSKLVIVVSIYAIRFMLGVGEGISEVHVANFKMADAMIDDLRAGLDNLPLYGAMKQIRSNVELVQDKFRQIG